MDIKFHEYLLEPSRDLSPATATIYFRAVQSLLATGASTPEDYREFIEDESRGPSRRHTYRRAMLHYAEWVEDPLLKEFLHNEVKIRGQSQRKKIPEALSKVEWFALIDEVTAHENKLLAATLVLLCTSGMRISEVIDLSRKTLEKALEEGKAVTLQKGGYQRWYMIIGEEQWTASSTLYEAMSPARNTVWKILLSSKWRKQSSILSAVSRELKHSSARAGIKKHVHPHMLRRSAGDAVRRAAHGDMKVVQDFLGHKSLKTTIQWYQDHFHPEEVEEALGKALER